MIITREQLDYLLKKNEERVREEIHRQHDIDTSIRRVYERIDELEHRLNRLCAELERVKHGEVLDGSPKTCAPRT